MIDNKAGCGKLLTISVHARADYWNTIVNFVCTCCELFNASHKLIKKIWHLY